MAAAGVPTAALLDAPRAPVRAEGRRAGGREGRRRLPDGGGARRRPRGRARIRRRGRRRGAARRAGAVAPRRLRRNGRARPRAARGTSSAPTTATRARTPAGWDRSRPFPTSATTRSTSLVETCIRPVLARAGSTGHALRRHALRRADADGGRPPRARVQLPVRRPGDAVGAAARRRRSPAPRWQRPRAGRSQASCWAASRRRGDRRARRRATTRTPATAARRSRGSPRPRRRGRWSSMPAPR